MGEIGLVMVVGLVVLLALGVPIAFTIGLLAAVGIWMAEVNPMILPQQLIAGSNVTSLLAIPGFILAGEVMSAGGLSRRLVRVAETFFGHLTGGPSRPAPSSAPFPARPRLPQPPWVRS